MLFTIVRVLLGLFGAIMVASALYGVPHAGLDHEWGAALSAFVGGILGVWLVRVGFNGTFSGNAPPKSAAVAPVKTEEL